MAVYSFDKINEEVPIEQVLELHGIRPNSKGWYRIREDEKDASAHIDKNKRFGNTIHDFGLSNTFNPITLTAYLQGVTLFEASQILGKAFGISPINNDKEKDNVVSAWEWKTLQIYPDMASKNMDFDPEKYGVEKTAAYAEKYRISMDALKTEDPSMYERIIRSRAISYLKTLQNTYYSSLFNTYNMARTISADMDVVGYVVNNKEFRDMAKELSQAEAALIKAIDGTSIKYKSSSYNVETDLNKVVSGKISFEVGPESHYELKRAAFIDKAKVFYCLVSLAEYNKLLENGMGDIRHAAFQKGDDINICFTSNDSSRVHYLVKALCGKELEIGKNNAEEHNKEDVVENKLSINKNAPLSKEIEMN